jgi:hypothetical protein
MTYQLTAIDIAAMRKCDRVVIVFNESQNNLRRTCVVLTKEARRSERDTFAQEIDHALEECPVRIENHGIFAGELAAANVTAFALLYTYHNQRDHEASVLRTLRAGDVIAFRFYADCHTNGYIAAAGLHGDALFLDVERGEGKARRSFTFEMHSSVCPNNSARMVRGLAESDGYRRDGARCRANGWLPPREIVAPVD